MKSNNLKVLIIGCGSIGQRHLRNLLSLGEKKICVYDVDPGILKKVAQEFNVETCDSLERGFEKRPEIAILSLPNHLHVEVSKKAAHKGINLFIEKPLSHNMDGIDELIKTVEKNRLITMVGCNMRYHPGPAKIKQLLEQESVGRIVFANIYAGSYLPEWHPQRDYRKSYSANASMGGGCILDYIHEIDLARWYLGDVEWVFCMAEHLSSLEIDVEDVAALVLKHTSGFLSEIHLDYVQRTYKRGCQIVGEKGSIFWDFGSGFVRLYEADSRRWLTFEQPDDWQVNQMYLDEMKYFLKCIHEGIPTQLPVSEAAKVLRIALAAKRSARSACVVSTGSAFQ